MQGRGREEKAHARRTPRTGAVKPRVNGKEDLADARSLVHAEFHLFSGSPLSAVSSSYRTPSRSQLLVLDLVMVACTLVHRLGGISAEISTAVGLVIRSAGVCSGAWYL